MDNLGIETRSRSRSKTPGLLSNENGDAKGSKKIPTVSLIEEEDDVIEVFPSQPSQSQRPKRQRRSAKAVQSDTSGGDVSADSPKNSQKSTEIVANNKQKVVNQSTTTTITSTTVVKSKQVINGSEEKNEQTITSTSVKNNIEVGSEVPENQSIFNNIFNAIKTSTPILSSKRSKRITQEVKSSENIDYNAHPAYKEYKEAGEYWNKFPKTDYTYSELSPHRRSLSNGVVAMPNMSRRSLGKYENRVEAMIQNNPTEESFLRRKFLSNTSFQKKSAELQYDSADEVDVSDLHQKLSSRRSTNTNFFYRFFTIIVTALSSAYLSGKQGVRRIFYYRTNNRYSYTPTKYQHQGLFQRILNSIQKYILLCISKVYLFISTVLCLDTWLLYSRSENAVENRKRKKFLLGLIIFFPLLLFGASYLSDDTSSSKIFSTSHYYPISSPINFQSITQYFPKFTPNQLFQSQWNFDFKWLLTPFLTMGLSLRDFIFGFSNSKEQLKVSMDEEKFQLLLQHIDNYIDNTIGQKINDNQNDVNNRLLIIIAKQIKDAIVQYEYQLTTKDIEAITSTIHKKINDNLDERDKMILSKISISSDEAVKKIEVLTSSNIDNSKNIKMNNEQIDLNEVIKMILSSEKLFALIDGRLKPVTNRLDTHEADISELKLNLAALKLEIVEKFTIYGNDIKETRNKQKTIADDLYRFKVENDELLKNYIIQIDEKLAKLSDYSSIDASVKKNILHILGFNFDETNASMDEQHIKSWISSTFVAKSFLEEKLQSLGIENSKVFQLQLDKNAGILMEEINKEIKNQVTLAMAEKNKEAQNENINISGGLLSEADVLRIVKGVLAIYDADKTGLVDYALESAGGEIISTRCTENYRTRSAEISIFGIPIWYPNNTPRTVISPSIAPGECWAFQGFPGYLVIKLTNMIQISGFTVEHIPQSNAPNGIIDSAPNNFSVWGLTSEFDKDPVLFGSYFYSAEKSASSLQFFPVQSKEIDRPYQIIELRIESNHGNPKYTCLYRFRVHGLNK